MHQLMTLDPTVVAYDKMDAADAGGPGGMLLPRCLPPIPSMTMKAMTAGIHATVSYLWCSDLDRSTGADQHIRSPVYDLVTEECDLDMMMFSPGRRARQTSERPTTSEIIPMMTIPRVSLRRSETLARVWPPKMQLRIRKPCMEKTVKALGMIEA